MTDIAKIEAKLVEWFSAHGHTVKRRENDAFAVSHWGLIPTPINLTTLARFLAQRTVEGRSR